MGFSYFSYNQDHDDQEKEEVPSFSSFDYNHVDERRDKLGIDFFKLNPLVLSLCKEECFKTLNMHHDDDDDNNDDDDDDDDDDEGEGEEEEEEEDSHEIACKSLIMNRGGGGGGEDEGPRKIDWGYLEELIAELLDEFELAMDRSVMMDNGQCSSVIKVQEDDDDLEHHSDINELADDFKVAVHGLHEVQWGHSEEQYICYQKDFIFYFFYPQLDPSSILPGRRLLLWDCIEREQKAHCLSGP